MSDETMNDKKKICRKTSWYQSPIAYRSSLIILYRSSFIVSSLIVCLSLCAPAHADSAKTAKSKSAPASRHDNHAPIEVTSDTLDVFQQQNKAVFSGHVVAIQQEVRLKADVMTVHYRKQEDKTAADKADKSKPAPAADVSPVGAEDSSITRIDAGGHVFLSTPLETASGDTGVYDVQHHLIHLNDHVILTKGKNVLKGDHLTYNFDTQQSVLTGGDGAAQTPKGAAGQQGVHPRVRALFVPGGDNKQKTDGSKEKAGMQ